MKIWVNDILLAEKLVRKWNYDGFLLILIISKNLQVTCLKQLLSCLVTRVCSLPSSFSFTANNITYILLVKCLKTLCSGELCTLCLLGRGGNRGDACSELSFFLRHCQNLLMIVQKVEVTRPEENHLGHLWLISVGLLPVL